jgi:6-phosphogluconolactonase
MSTLTIAGREQIADDQQTLARLAADWLVETLNSLPGELRIALSGGSTPKELYRLLASDPYRDRMPWRRLSLFWGDERFVPHDSPQSNYRMVQQTLLRNAPISPARVHPMPVDGTPAQAALAYEAELKGVYGADRLDDSRPLFDVTLLGLGTDGHTCSLLPGQPVLEERQHWVAAVMSGREEPRVTLTYPAIESSRVIAFMVSGADKAQAVKAVRSGNFDLPAARIRARGDVVWFLDKAAAEG